MKGFLKFCTALIISATIGGTLLMSTSVMASTTTVVSAEYKHMRGSYCSMVTEASYDGSSTTLVDYYFKKYESLGYKFTNNAPYKQTFSTYDVYRSKNSLKWMNGTTWNFDLTTTHNHSGNNR